MTLKKMFGYSFKEWKATLKEGIDILLVQLKLLCLFLEVLIKIKKDLMTSMNLISIVKLGLEFWQQETHLAQGHFTKQLCLRE